MIKYFRITDCNGDVYYAQDIAYHIVGSVTLLEWSDKEQYRGINVQYVVLIEEISEEDYNV